MEIICPICKNKLFKKHNSYYCMNNHCFDLSKEGYEGYTVARKIISKSYIKLVSVASGFKHSDSQCGIK